MSRRKTKGVAMDATAAFEEVFANSDYGESDFEDVFQDDSQQTYHRMSVDNVADTTDMDNDAMGLVTLTRTLKTTSTEKFEVWMLFSKHYRGPMTTTG
jgi:hypothetical protein